MHNPVVVHTIKGTAAASAILLAESLPDVGGDAINALERLGLAIALVVFFVWTGWRREVRMGARIDKLETQLAKVSQQNAVLVERVSDALMEENRLIRDALQVITERFPVVTK